LRSNLLANSTVSNLVADGTVSGLLSNLRGGSLGFRLLPNLRRSGVAI